MSIAGKILRSHTLTIECVGNCYSSSNSIIEEIAGNLKLHDHTRETKRARLSKSGNTSHFSTRNVEIEAAVMSYIQENTDDSAEKYPTLAVLLSNSEELSPIVFGNLLEDLSKFKNVRFFFVLSHFSSCPVPLPTDSGHRRLLEIKISPLPSTWEFYDSIMLSLLSMNILPLIFSSDILLSISRNFEDNDRCISSMVERLCVYVACHFKNRQALLCLSTEHKLLADLRLLVGKARSESSKQMKCIQALLPYMSILDLKDTGLLNAKNPLSIPTDDDVYGALSLLSSRINVDRCILRSICHIRNCIIPATEHATLAMDKIWVDLQSSKSIADSSTVLGRFYDLLKLHVLFSSVATLGNTLLELKTLFKSYSSSSEEEISPDKYCVSHVLHVSERISDLEIVLDEIEAIILSSKYCSLADINTQDNLRSMERKLHFFEESAENPVGGDVAVEMCGLKIDDIFGCFIDDYCDFIYAFIDSTTKLPRPNMLNGIISVSPSATFMGNSYSNSNLRTMYVLKQLSLKVYIC